jgi:hypothetical protein
VCHVAGFHSLWLFLAAATPSSRRQIFQLNFVGAFLQATAIGQKFTILPLEVKVFFPEWSHWFGIPLLIVKSLYGCPWGKIMG